MEIILKLIFLVMFLGSISKVISIYFYAWSKGIENNLKMVDERFFE